MNEDFRPFKMICEDTIKLDKKNNKNIFLGWAMGQKCF
jgi:hypothetical protein